MDTWLRFPAGPPVLGAPLKAPGIRSVRKRTSVFCSKRELSRKWLIWPKRRKHHRFQTLTHPKMQLTSSLVMHKAQLRCTAGEGCSESPHRHSVVCAVQPESWLLSASGSGAVGHCASTASLIRSKARATKLLLEAVIWVHFVFSQNCIF